MYMLLFGGALGCIYDHGFQVTHIKLQASNFKTQVGGERPLLLLFAKCVYTSSPARSSAPPKFK